MLNRPERYVEPSRFETMPSQPSLQACAKTISPLPTMCSLSAIPSDGLRSSSWASPALRTSIGSRLHSRHVIVILRNNDYGLVIMVRSTVF
jgi:hypothetical protein